MTASVPISWQCIKPSEAARKLGVCKKTFYRACCYFSITLIRFHRNFIRIPESELARLLELYRPPYFVTWEKAAKRERVSERTIRRWVSRFKIPAVGPPRAKVGITEKNFQAMRTARAEKGLRARRQTPGQ